MSGGVVGRRISVKLEKKHPQFSKSSFTSHPTIAAIQYVTDSVVKITNWTWESSGRRKELLEKGYRQKNAQVQNLKDPVKPISKRTNVFGTPITISFTYRVYVKTPSQITSFVKAFYFIHSRNQITALTGVHGQYAIRPQLAPLRHPFLPSVPLTQQQKKTARGSSRTWWWERGLIKILS